MIFFTQIIDFSIGGAILFQLTKFEDVNRSFKVAKEIFEQRIKDAMYTYSKHSNHFSIRPCPICGSIEFTEMEPFHGTYGVAKCNVCSSLYVNPCPSTEAIIDYYQNCKCNQMLDEVYRNRPKNNQFILDKRVKKILDYLKSFESENINILEIGCGSGHFLRKLKYFIENDNSLSNKQISLNGVDIDKNAIEKMMIHDPCINLICSTAEEYVLQTMEKYDLILSFELIEHLIDPFLFIKSIHQLLSENGLFILTTPNENGLEMVASGYNSFRLLAHAIFPPMHLNAFSTTNISHFAIRGGFKIISITTPGSLDVDMVSLVKDELTDLSLIELSKMSEEKKAIFQEIVSNKLNASSHMEVILQKQ